eukprot:TRINITY_DN24189_c0_g1_i3.p1 TRINITY_DN24189_c0_g1~~TRINITY_DN24189_c0_g1_i3.p1  ORF type:complete len:126 (+),score=48.07 TRINITY_DN24189_c0_g1_i3:3-380(+)
MMYRMRCMDSYLYYYYAWYTVCTTLLARKADPKKAAPSKDKEVKAEKPARKRKALDFFKADADNKAAAVAELGLPKYDAAKVPNHLYTKFKSLSEAEKAKWIALETADAARWEADMKKFGGSAQK